MFSSLLAETPEEYVCANGRSAWGSQTRNEPSNVARYSVIMILAIKQRPQVERCFWEHAICSKVRPGCNTGSRPRGASQAVVMQYRIRQA